MEVNRICFVPRLFVDDDKVEDFYYYCFGKYKFRNTEEICDFGKSKLRNRTVDQHVKECLHQKCRGIFENKNILLSKKTYVEVILESSLEKWVVVFYDYLTNEKGLESITAKFSESVGVFDKKITETVIVSKRKVEDWFVSGMENKVRLDDVPFWGKTQEALQKALIKLTMK